MARASIRVLVEEKLAERSYELGTYFMEQLAEIPTPHVREVRGKGLLIGVALKPEAGGARRFCENLKHRGILAKETHENTIRFAPPLIIEKETLDDPADLEMLDHLAALTAEDVPDFASVQEEGLRVPKQGEVRAPDLVLRAGSILKGYVTAVDLVCRSRMP